MITFIGSPNYDTNRTKIDRIVIHWMAGTLAGTDAVFQRQGGTSAHYGIEEDTIHQYVKEEHVAYHAGNYAMNQRSIGIEHSAQPGRNASDLTYVVSGELIATLSKKYSIPLDRQHIIGHKEVPVNTLCPGTMDIDRLIAEAKKHLTPQITDDFKKKMMSYNVYYEFPERVIDDLKAKDKRIKELEVAISGKDKIIADTYNRVKAELQAKTIEFWKTL